MGTEERKNREKEEMRKLILHTAMKLFLHEGIENVSMRRIAESIEYSPASIYSYYKDKAEIVMALHNEGFDKLYAMQTSLDTIPDPLEKLRQMGLVYMKFALENRDYYDLMFIAKGIALKIQENKHWDVGVRSFMYLRDTVQQCIEQKFFIQADVDAVTFVFWSVVHGMAALIIRGRCEIMPEDMVDRMIKDGLRFLFESTVQKQIK